MRQENLLSACSPSIPFIPCRVSSASISIPALANNPPRLYQFISLPCPADITTARRDEIDLFLDLTQS